MTDDSYWEEAYKSGRPEATPWEVGEPDGYLVELVNEGKIPGKLVLDTCSGLGTQSIYLSNHGYQVYGIELSPTAVAKAAVRAEAASAQVNFINTTVQEMPFDNDLFDFILDRGCLHHQYGNELRNYLSEVRRVLKAGGRMYIMAFTSRFSTEEIESLFEEDFTVLDHSILEFKAADNSTREFHHLFLEKK